MDPAEAKGLGDVTSRGTLEAGSNAHPAQSPRGSARCLAPGGCVSPLGGKEGTVTELRKAQVERPEEGELRPAVPRG